MLDVAIIGAGPAGCWAAYHLARRGARVALIDGSHPREKPCGGGVTGRALMLVSQAPGLDRLASCAVRTARFIDPMRPLEKAPVVTLERGSLAVASRSDFDSLLLRAALGAGADFVPSRALDVVRDGTAFRIVTAGRSVRAAFVIGADGANSLVRRRIAQPFTRAALSIATGYFARGPTSDEIVLEFIDDPPGYLWSFARPTHLSVGICVQADAGVTAPALRARAARWMRQLALAADARLEAYSWPIPSLSAAAIDSQTIAGPGWLLAGDAAGLVDPITREGIYFALVSGEWAADAIASASRAAEAEYALRVRDQIGAELARAAKYKASFFQGPFTQLMLDALGNSPGIRVVMADLLAGRQTYSGLKRRLAGTFELRLAFRLLNIL